MSSYPHPVLRLTTESAGSYNLRIHTFRINEIELSGDPGAVPSHRCRRTFLLWVTYSDSRTIRNRNTNSRMLAGRVPFLSVLYGAAERAAVCVASRV